MSSNNEDLKNESINSNKILTKNNSIKNTSESITESHNKKEDTENKNNGYQISDSNKVDVSNTTIEDEIEENKVVYEINFPPSEEEIKPNANRVKTTKYNIFTFLPLNLYSQFHRFSNIYFLLGALSTLFGYTVVSPVAQIMPLIIVLSVTAIKDAYGDIKRSSDDKKANNEPYYILRNNGVQKVLCQDIFPGDIIIIQKGEKIPADCILLSSSNDDGICYVETSDLDGETSLKKKTSLSELSCIRDLEGFTKIQGKIQCEPPCDSFSSFEGRIYFETVFKPRHKDTNSISTTKTNLSSISREIKKNITNVSNMIRGNSSFVKVGSSMPDSSLPLNINQMLFRGSVLRNTECVYLMAIYTGRETRAYRNSKQVGLKMSTLEPKLNRYLIYIFILNFFILFVSVILQLCESYKIIHKKRGYRHWYLYINGKWNTFNEILKSVLSFFALYTYFVPLSLFVTLEVVRIIQSWFFQWDHLMMGQKEVDSEVKPTNDTILNLDNDPNLISSRVNSADVNKRRKVYNNSNNNNQLMKLSSTNLLLSQQLELLAQQQESENKNEKDKEKNQNQLNQNENDKNNSKSMKQWVPMKVNSLNLGEDLGAIQYIFSDKTGTLTKNMMILTKWCIDGKIFDAFNEPSCLHQEVHNLYKDNEINKSIKNEEFKDKILEYCRALATCHEVMISYDPASYKPVYESQSPDETAIVTGLEKAGIRLISRTKDNIQFQIWDNEESHEILLLTEFTSDRKCMTVIVKRETDKGSVYTLYTKGADDIISRRLSTNPAVNNESVLINTMNALKLFGKMGYRVLMVAERIIDKETYETFINMYRKAECSLGNRAKNVAKALEYIERDLILLGLTAVEDQLQDNIPETIDYLLNAGIKMWLLTGDQQDTAINIGLSSCLLNNNSNLMILNDKTYRKCEKTLEKYINEMKDNDEWGYPMINYNKKDKDEDDSVMYDEKHDKKFDVSKLSYKWEKNVLVVNGDSLAAIFGSQPVKKDKTENRSHNHEHVHGHNHHNHNHNHNRNHDNSDTLHNSNNENIKKTTRKKSLHIHRKSNASKIYPEDIDLLPFNRNNVDDKKEKELIITIENNNDNNIYNSTNNKFDNNLNNTENKINENTNINNNDNNNSNKNIENENENDNNNNNNNNDINDIHNTNNKKNGYSPLDRYADIEDYMDNNDSSSGSSSNIRKKRNLQHFNDLFNFNSINNMIMTSIDNMRKAIIQMKRKQRRKERERRKKKEEENKKKKNNEPYDPKNLTPLQRKFIEVGIRCRTVICCRVTPIQKANVVKAVRHNLNAVTLAIGDGANDVAMIQAAHIGVGIMGREGAQAVRASDYAFLEFRFLKPLLCIHGRYTFLQITKLILYSFYKNIVLSLILFFYGFVSLWSGNTILENYFLLSYNLFYTCFFILVLACYERDISVKAIYDNPKLYIQVKDGIYWSLAKRFGWILSSIWHGLVIVFIMIYMFNDNIMRQDGGSSISFWAECYIIQTILILVVTLKCATIHERFTILSLITCILSLCIYVVFMLIIDYIFFNFESSILVISGMPDCYLIILFGVVTSLLPDYVVYYVKSNYYPSDAQIIFQERKINKSKVRYNKLETPMNNNSNYSIAMDKPLLAALEEEEINLNNHEKEESPNKNDIIYPIELQNDNNDSNNNKISDTHSKQNSLTNNKYPVFKSSSYNNMYENNNGTILKPPRPMISKKLSEILIEKNENKIEFPLRSKSTILQQNSLLYQKSFMSETDINIKSTKNNNGGSFLNIKNSNPNYVHISDNNINEYNKMRNNGITPIPEISDDKDKNKTGTERNELEPEILSKKEDESKNEKENGKENINEDEIENDKEDENNSTTKEEGKKDKNEEKNNDDENEGENEDENEGENENENEDDNRNKKKKNKYFGSNATYSNSNTDKSDSSSTSSSNSSESSSSTSDSSNDSSSNTSSSSSSDDINIYSNSKRNISKGFFKYNDKYEHMKEMSKSDSRLNLKYKYSKKDLGFNSTRSSAETIYMNLPSGDKRKLPSIKNRKIQFTNDKKFY